MNLRTCLGWKRTKKTTPSPAKRTRPLFAGFERLEDRQLMAVADLTAYRPVTEYIKYQNYKVPEAAEESPLTGPGIRINGDDDNGNRKADFLDKTTKAAGDGDLVRVDIAGDGTSYTLAWTGPLAVWTTATKKAAIAQGSSVAAGQTVWVEYASLTHSVDVSAALTLTVADASGTASDSVVFHSFQSTVIAIGGNGQDPKKVGDPRLGMFTIATSLYEQGYDVHLYAYSHVGSNGRGAAYDEVTSAVLKRNVDNVAIYGYSWGGAATHNLVAGLKANKSLAGQFQLRYTAYVDGISRGGISSERRLPPLTQHHDNFFQRKDFLLKGSTVTGADNVNVTLTPWGSSLGHTTIDDSPTLQSLIETNLKLKLAVA